jgi:hypothetical protein
MMPATTTPYTFAASTRSRPGPVFVQVKIAQSSNCARVREGWIANDGAFLWALDLLFPFQGRASFPEMRVRSCSGVDGRCLCAGETGAAKPGAGSTDRASAAPHEAGDLSEKEVTCL